MKPLSIVLVQPANVFYPVRGRFYGWSASSIRFVSSAVKPVMIVPCMGAWFSVVTGLRGSPVSVGVGGETGWDMSVICLSAPIVSMGPPVSVGVVGGGAGGDASVVWGRPSRNHPPIPATIARHAAAAQNQIRRFPERMARRAAAANSSALGRRAGSTESAKRAKSPAGPGRGATAPG